jgi:hypothetical protein
MMSMIYGTRRISGLKEVIRRRVVSINAEVKCTIGY